MLTQSVETGIYCPIVGQIAAISTDGSRCTGEILVTGDGVRENGDTYGEKYKRPCSKTRGVGGIITRADGKVTINRCMEVDVGRLGAGGPDSAQFPSVPE